jgi:hypothetical protein
VRSAAALLLLGGVLFTAAGCGAGRTATPAELRLEREDLIAVSHALQTVVAPVGDEVAATKSAWPLVANGLAPDRAATAAPAIATAAERAASISVPALLQESQAASLTGPAATVAGSFRSYASLSTRGWELIRASVKEILGGSPAAARFARENIDLYIDSVYDGHFSLAQIDKQLRAGYRKLGGQAAFGESLTQAEVDALANAYSEATDRLHPHVGVKLGT